MSDHFTPDQPTLQLDVKLRINEFLPTALKYAMHSYIQFSKTTKEPEGTKDFTSFHTSCKVAIAHIELLLKLAKWADAVEAIPNKGGIGDETLLSLIKIAEEECRETTKK